MKSVKESLLERRSIRRYEREAIPAEQMQLIYDAIRNTPTSFNGQQFSVIDVTDPELKEKLYELTEEKQIKTCSHFLVFIADYNKISVAAEAMGEDMPDYTNTIDGLMVSVIDASLAMMSAVTVAESLGLGCCPIGYARTAAPEKIAMALNLPQKTFVVCGLSIGVPREMPDLKPKQPQELMIFSNKYPGDMDKMAVDLMKYNAEVKEFNQTRTGDKSDFDWVGRILYYYGLSMDLGMLRAFQRRGFDPKR